MTRELLLLHKGAGGSWTHIHSLEGLGSHQLFLIVHRDSVMIYFLLSLKSYFRCSSNDTRSGSFIVRSSHLSPTAAKFCPGIACTVWLISFQN